MRKQIVALFERRQIACQVLGDLRRPSIIVDGGVMITAEITGHFLHFYNAAGGHCGRIDLYDCDNLTREGLINYVRDCHKERSYRLRLAGTDLFVVGYQVEFYQTSLLAEEGIKYPCFAKFNPMTFPREVAHRIHSLTKDYDIEIDQYPEKGIFYE